MNFILAQSLSHEDSLERAVWKNKKINEWRRRIWGINVSSSESDCDRQQYPYNLKSWPYSFVSLINEEPNPQDVEPEQWSLWANA